MTNPVFFGPADQLRSAVCGGTIVLAGSEGRHAATVMRLSPGQGVDIVDGAGLRLSARVTAVRAGELTARIDTVIEEVPEAHEFVLVQALAKGDRAEQAIETATELGVDAIVPWQSDRSIVRWKGDRATKAHAKWQSTARAATKQSRRAALPLVDEVVDTPRLASQLAAGSGLALLLHEDAAVTVAATVRQWHDSTTGPGNSGAATGRDGNAAGGRPRIYVIVGPEGGITERELILLQTAGAVPASLGRHILRSSTAGPAALVVLNQLLDRWM